jgi:hypothetical protein
MKRYTLTRIAIITAIIACVSLSIAGVIGAKSGVFRTTNFAIRMNPGIFLDVRQSTFDETQIVQPADQIHNITVKTVSENITVREVSGESIKARFHGTAGTSDDVDAPHLKMQQRGDAVEFIVERSRNGAIGPVYDNAALDVSIPRRYAGNLSVESVSADITLGGHSYKGLALKTVCGNIKTDARVAVSGDTDAHTVSGDISLSFAQKPGSISAKATSGNIGLAVPSETQFTLDAHTVSGEVSCDFPIKLVNSKSGDHEHALDGAVGNGRNTIMAHTVSGDIRITRATGVKPSTPPTGASPKQAVDVAH